MRSVIVRSVACAIASALAAGVPNISNVRSIAAASKMLTGSGVSTSTLSELTYVSRSLRICGSSFFMSTTSA